MRGHRRLISCSAAVLLLFGTVTGCKPTPAGQIEPVAAPAPPPAARSQNPSPMVESARRHERIPAGQPPGIAFRIDSVFAKAVDVYIPDRKTPVSNTSDDRTLLIHLFGASYIPMHAVVPAKGDYVLAVVNLGAGSAAYERPLSDTAAWNTLLQKIRDETASRTQGRVHFNRIAVSAFSAGYGGVRALLSDDRIAASINAVILLDGLHTSYLPERSVLAEGGTLDTTKLVPFLRYAKRAVAGETQMVITHSEIFPGTFASTTETTDWLIGALGLMRSPVLAWGPGGMQQISEVKRGGLAIMGFAGNTGPDHIDHLHGLDGFLTNIEQPGHTAR